MKLNLLFLSLFVNSVVYNHVFAAEQVLFAGASHIGGRPNNEDAWNEDYFSVNDKKYYLSMVCDGHAGETIAKFVRKEFSSILQKCLKSETDIGQAFYNAFEQCDNTILKTQNIQGNNEPGTTAVMMLSDASKREQYIANLGDSRFCIISADDGRLKWSTEDHTLTTEKDYIESHGGEIRRGTTGDPGIFLKNG